MANGDESPALRIYSQADVGTTDPATVGATGRLIGAIVQRSAIYGPANSGLGIRRRCHAA